MATPTTSPSNPVLPSPSPSSSWSHPDWEPLLSYSPTTSSWHCSVRPRGSSPDTLFTSFEPNGPGYPTPEAALSAASVSVSALLPVQEEALAVETVRLLTERRLRAVEVEEEDPVDPVNRSPIPVTKWQARDDAGVWTDPVPTPQEATKTARRMRGSASTSTSNSSSSSPSTSFPPSRGLT